MKHDKADDRVPLCHMVRRDGVWRVADHPSSAGVLALTDEGDFMRYMLNEGVPLPIAGVLYHPVHCEFPSSPGVDMIWASDDGRFALGELKMSFRGYPVPCEELAHHYLRIEGTSVASLVRSAGHKTADIAPGAFSRLERLIGRDPSLKTLTFGDLRAQDRLQLVIVFASTPGELSAPPTPFLAAHMVARTDSSADVRLSGPMNKEPTDARPHLVRMARRHRDGLAQARMSSFRVTRTADTVVAHYLNRPSGDPARTIVEHGRARGLDLRPGGGRSVGLSFTVRSNSGALRPLLCLTRPDTLFLQTNLIAYHAEFGVPREVIASALEGAAAAFPPDLCTLTGANRRPRFDLRRFTPADTARLIRFVSDLLGKLGR